jgi:hypothetical protein
MIEGLKFFLNALINAGPKLYGLYNKERKEEKIIELLESCFILRDLIQTAEELLELVIDKQEINFLELESNELEEHYCIVQAKLTIQLQRLQRLGDIFLSNPTIDLLDTNIKKRLKKAIGGKEEGLFTVGAGLFFNQIFGCAGKQDEPDSERIPRIVKEKYEFVQSIMGGDQISLAEQRAILQELKSLQQQYISALKDVLEPSHKLILASKAEELAAKWGLRK